MDPTTPPTTPIKTQKNYSFNEFLQPHIPISQNEMQQEPHQKKSSANTLLTLTSLLILAFIIILTLYLYINNNKTVHLPAITNKASDQSTTTESSEKLDPLPPCSDETVYTTIDSALLHKQTACTLDLSFSQTESIPSTITQLTNLRTLYLTGNKLTQIPPIIFQFKYLTRLDINSNNLQSIPKEIDSLKYLAILNLTNNQIKTVPNEISHLGELKDLELGANKILPTEQKRLSKMLPSVKIIFNGQMLASPTTIPPYTPIK